MYREAGYTAVGAAAVAAGTVAIGGLGHATRNFLENSVEGVAHHVHGGQNPEIVLDIMAGSFESLALLAVYGICSGLGQDIVRAVSGR